MKKHSDEITNDTVKSILRKRGFFDDLQWLSNILLPIKAAIHSLESYNTILADCYIALLQIAASIKKLPTEDYHEFRTYYISTFNKR